MAGSLAWRIVLFPLLQIRSRAALVLPLNIKFENVLARFCWLDGLGAPWGRRFWRHLPSSKRELISPLAHAAMRRSKQAFNSLVFGLEDGFCRASTDSTEIAFRAMGSSAEGSEYALKSLLSSFTNSLPPLPNGTWKEFLFQCTTSK